MRARTRPNDTANVDMTPMLDIVFILLIFFIVSATFLDESGIDLTRPDPGGVTTQAPSILVTVGADGACAIDGAATGCDRVMLGIERRLADSPDANVVLRVHRASAHATLVELKDKMDAARLRSVIEVVAPETA